jgi:hypothetical protein
MPVDHRNLAIALRNAPYFFILVRGSELEHVKGGVIDEFVNLAHFDSITQYYINSRQTNLNSRSIKETVVCPNSSMAAQHAFERWRQ